MPAPEIVSLREDDLQAAAAALARAFQDDPLQVHMLPDPVERAALSPAHFASILRHGQQFGEVLTTAGPPQGAVVCLPPDGWSVTPGRVAAAGLDQLPAIVGEAAAGRFSSIMGLLESHHHRDAPSAHWYVTVLGVAPEAQGRGFGRALLQPVLDRAAAAGVPCYLETAQPGNAAFYEHLGFRRLSEIVETRSGLTMWAFRRDPPVRG